MNQFEFIRYQEIENDQYMEGIATVRVYSKVILRFKVAKTKDGGTFITPATYQVLKDGQKSYVKCFMLDSQAENEMLDDFIRDGIKKAKLSKGSIQTASSAFSPTPHVVKEVHQEEQLPF